MSEKRKLPGDGGGGGTFNCRLDDVIRDSLVEVSKDFSERASDEGRVGREGGGTSPSAS
ncbi:hypothetical protein C1H46_008223 [Malus baccata]|uniref:Uncharacterized protein n=1 Tax=Malus baccata TaxID=106549 RepID=A0A540N530_MALBA|nr:hypothetical protein C1H46_008223 [Malus baccata]